MDANNTPTWNFEGKEYPLFPFDVPQTIKLQNGTVHHFRLWDAVTEKHRESLMKTIVITSAAIINNERPQDSKTDYTKALLSYYESMCEGISGVQLNGEAPDTVHKIHDLTNIDMGDGKKARILDLISVPIRKEAAAKLYGGKIDVERPDDEEEDIEVDPFTDLDLTKEIQKQEKPSTVYRLSLNRQTVIRQEIGVEQLRNGQSTDATHVIRYFFDEPDAKEFSKWELHAFNGFSTSRPKGGERIERFYNLDTLDALFNTLIDRIEGASIGGEPVMLPSDRNDPVRIALLKKVPLGCKKYTVARLFSEMNNLGNA